MLISGLLTLVINLAVHVHCHNFLPGLWSLSRLQTVTTFGWYQFIMFAEQRQMYVNNLPRVTVWQQNDWDWAGHVYNTSPTFYLLQYHTIRCKSNSFSKLQQHGHRSRSKIRSHQQSNSINDKPAIFIV